MAKKTISALLALALSASLLGACSLRLPDTQGLLGTTDDSAGDAQAPAQAEADVLKIAYNSDDSLEAYGARSMMNLNITALIYDPLVKLDQQYTPHNVVAREVVVTAQECVVTIRAGLVFSDGSPLTARDVVYSARRAMSEGSAYAGLLSNVESVSATDGETVRFALAQPDRMFQNLLTFPIVSEGNEALGSGRYLLDAAGAAPYLTINPKWYGRTNAKIKTIRLVSQMDKDTLIYSLKLGTINYAYSDLSSEEAFSLGISTQYVPLNNLVYLGVNSTKRILANSTMRQALSDCIDREKLVDGTFASRAQASELPFHPQLAQTQGIAGGWEKRDAAAAAAVLEGLGYSERDEEGYFLAGQERLKLRLLVNSENKARLELAQQMQSMVRELGIELSIDARTYEQYQAALALWDFDLFLGEVKLYNNMDLSAMLSPMRKLGFGLTENERLLEQYALWRSGGADLESFTDAFREDTPFIPILYRSGIVSFSRDIFFDVSATEQDIFYQIEAW